MLKFIGETPAPAYFLLTECGLTSRLQLEHPTKKFVGSCTMCRYMKSNTLADIARVLTAPDSDDEIHLDPSDIDAADRCIEQMFMYTAMPAK